MVVLVSRKLRRSFPSLASIVVTAVSTTVAIALLPSVCSLSTGGSNSSGGSTTIVEAAHKSAEASLIRRRLPASPFSLRPYNPTADASVLDEICHGVYGGTDYLPKVATSYASDPSCSFLALTELTTSGECGADDATGDGEILHGEDSEDEGGSILAVGNYRRLPGRNAVWIEGVRTHPRRRGRGAATALMLAFIDLALKESDTREINGCKSDNDSATCENGMVNTIYTCTVESNMGMCRALEKAGCELSQTAGLRILSFDGLKFLPGWSRPLDADENILEEEMSPPRPQNLLAALDLEKFVNDSSKSPTASSWKEIRSIGELSAELNRVYRKGGSGFLPGLYELISPEPTRRDLRDSLERGLVFSLNDEEGGPAVVALLRDDRIDSLRSPWLCSIAATTGSAFESALWHACSDGVIQRMNSEKAGHGNHGVDGSTEEGFVQFCLSFDAAVPLTEKTLAAEMPLDKDPCVVYSYGEERDSR